MVLNITGQFFPNTRLFIVMCFLLFLLDVARVQEACNKKTFQHTNLKIKSLVVSNCIIVTEFSEKTTESSLEYYFDNKRRSGVEHVEEIQMKDNYCLIHFQNHEGIVCVRVRLCVCVCVCMQN